MTDKIKNGDFTRNLFSLQMQIKTLLDGAGGDDASELLDKLSELNKSERVVVLRVFQRALDKLKDSGIRVSKINDDMQKDFEHGLYDNLIDGMNALKHDHLKHDHFTRTLSVVDGGKLPTKQKKEAKMLCLADARKRLRSSDVRQKGCFVERCEDMSGESISPVIN